MYEKVMGVKLDGQLQAKMNMQKAYISFASQPNVLPDGTTSGTRNRWPDLIVDAAMRHQEYITAMHDGYYPPDVK